MQEFYGFCSSQRTRSSTPIAKNAAAKSRLCRLLRATWGGHETPLIYHSIRMATRRAQRDGGALLRPLQQLLLFLLLQPLLLSGSWLACSAATAPAEPQVEAKKQTPKEAEGAPSVSDVTLLERRQTSPGAVSERLKRGTGRSGLDKEDAENLELLRNVMVDADATETEKPTDSRYL